MRAAIAIIVAIAAVLAYGFLPTTGYTFATGSFNLTIDSKASWNGVSQPNSTWALKNLVPGVDKFFNISDIKPGDTGEATISFHVNKDAWICLDFENLKQYENGINDPESLEDGTGGVNQGELAAGTEFFAWYDDGDNIFENGEKPIFGTSSPKQAATVALNNMTYALADSIAGTAFPAGVTKYIGITWCAGNLTVVTTPPVSITCDGAALGNEAQSDSFSVDIGFRAVPKNDNPKFSCKKPNNKCEWPGPVNIVINNSGTINSTTTSSASTGGYTAGSGGVVTTGDATSIATSSNTLNTTVITTGGLTNIFTSFLNRLGRTR